MKGLGIKCLFFSIAIIQLRCTDKTPEFTITGNIKGQEGKTLLIQKFENNKPVSIDSTVIDKNGDFTIETILPFTDFYQIRTDPGNVLVFIAAPGDKISIETTKLLGEPNKISGSADTKLLLDFTKDFNRYMLQRDSIGSKMQEGIPQIQVVEMMNSFDQQILKYLHDFIDKNSASPAALAALSKLNPVQDIAYFKKVKDSIAPKMRNSAYFIYLENQIMQAEQEARQQEEAQKTLPIGSAAPEISMPDPMGKIRSLSELRGKVVLIDFWASWCRPCRAENPNVVNAYKEFKTKGFEVFSVSLDKNGDAWKNAIMEDGLAWTHVSDLQFWNSAAAKKYGVQSIPFAVLIDAEGNIIAKNLRGAELTRKLREILG